MKNMFYVGLVSLLLTSCSNKFFVNKSLNEHEVQTVKPLIIPNNFELPPAQNTQHQPNVNNIKTNSQATEELMKGQY